MKERHCPAQLHRAGGIFRHGDDGMPAAEGGPAFRWGLLRAGRLAVQGGDGLPSPLCGRRDR